MSPEQGSGETSKIDARSDVYSLGVMMYQMATGRLPFPGSNFGEVLMGHLQKTPPAPRSIVPEIPEDYEAVILKCIEKSQDARYQSMAELHDAIFDVMQAHGISSELPFSDETEEMPPIEAGTPSKPGTPSRPPGTRASNPPRQISGPPRTPGPRANTGGAAGKPAARGPNSRSGSTQPPQKKENNNFAIIAGGVGLLIILIVGGESATRCMRRMCAPRRKQPLPRRHRRASPQGKTGCRRRGRRCR